MIKPDLSIPIPEQLDRVHFIGIGGSGMSGIARMMLDAGVRVSGSDRSENSAITALRGDGAEIWIGHDGDKLPEVDAVVVTSALWPDNPELLAARERGIPVLHRSQALHALARSRRVVAVAGAHGKTTSTGMAVTALRELGIDAGFVNGGVIGNLGASSGSGSADLFVLEADESDGSFLLYDVAVALVTNVDTDHLDHYGSPEAFDAAFAEFANRASEAVVISADDPGAQRVRALLTHPRILTFGTAPEADVRLREVTPARPATFVLDYAGRSYGGSIEVAGFHNAVNAAGVFATLVALGADPERILPALAPFTGVGRRFEPHGVVDGVAIYDDYAHHPVEVEAALTAARTATNGRLIAVHQPHLYSRTRDMAGEFAEVYERLADHTVILDVHGAREDPIPGVTGQLVADGFRDAAKRSYCPDWDDAAARVAEVAAPGDLVMTLSCGDVYRIIPQLQAALADRAAQ